MADAEVEVGNAVLPVRAVCKIVVVDREEVRMVVEVMRRQERMVELEEQYWERKRNPHPMMPTATALSAGSARTSFVGES